MQGGMVSEGEKIDSCLGVRGLPGGASLPGGSVVKNLQCRRPGFDPWVRKIPWRRAWQCTPVSYLENPTARGAWQATVRRVTKSWSQLK